jgi:transposase-like protein
MDSEPAPREARRTMQKIPVPRDWQDYIQNNLLQAIALARVALTDVWSGFENGPLVCAQQAARIARLETQLALLGEELRIKDARMARIAPRTRPHYPPCERLAVLMLRAAAGWNAAETARRFLVTATTIASWMKRLDEGGEEALLRTAAPVSQSRLVTPPGWSRVPRKLMAPGWPGQVVDPAAEGRPKRGPMRSR